MPNAGPPSGQGRSEEQERRCAREVKDRGTCEAQQRDPQRLSEASWGHASFPYPRAHPGLSSSLAPLWVSPPCCAMLLGTTFLRETQVRIPGGRDRAAESKAVPPR